MFRIAPFAETHPELSAASWQRLDDAREIERLLYVAHASVLANEVFVASLWDDGGERLRGLALATAIEHKGERWMALTRGFDVGKSVLVARDEAATDVADELFAALREHARRAGFHRLILAPTDVERQGVLSSAERAGFRLIETICYELRLPPTDTFDAFVTRLNANQRKVLKRDLRLLTEDRFEFVEESPPARETLERSWPLYLALLARKGVPLGYRGNFLVELARRAPPDALSFVRCMAGQRQVGCAIGVHEGESVVFNPVAVAGDIDAPLFPAIGAFWLRGVIDRGTRTVFLGQYNDVWKRRLGATPITYRYGFLRL